MKLILLLVGLAMMWGAGQGIYVAVTNTEPTSINCADYEQNGSEKDWLELTDCYIDNLEVVATYSEGDTNIDKNDTFYVSIRSSAETPVFAFMKVSSSFAQTTYVNVFTLQDDEEKYIKFFEDNPKQKEFIDSVGPRTIKGLILFGIDSDDADLKVLKGFIEKDEFAIIEQDKSPEIGMSLFLFAIGLGALGLFGYLAGKK